jgi:putative membrane protein
MMPYGWNDGVWGFVWMTLSMMVMIGAIAALVALVIRHPNGDGRNVDEGSDPRGLLAERYARGEIDADEYRERLDTLEEIGSARSRR